MEIRASILLLLFSFLPMIHKINTAELDAISDSRFLTDKDTLVSATRIFELGFFQPDGSKNTYLGIWYKQISATTVVWVANRDRPLSGASPHVLKVVDTGTLVLLNNNSIIWSSNTTTLMSPNSSAMLHDNGNLVLVNQQEEVLWQSFDYPTDTLLPGMKIGKDYSRGIEWHLSSWKSIRDPSPGDFTLGADTRGYPENKLKQGEMVRYRVGPWRNQRFTGISTFSANLTTIYTVVITEKEESFSYHVENSSMLTRVTLNSSGEMDVWAGVEDGKKWQLSLKLPIDICDSYNICGTYGSCSVNTYQLSCACLDEKRFVPRNKRNWGTANWTDGCVRRTAVGCEKEFNGFIKYSNVKLPDTRMSWFNLSMSLEECGSKCLENCSCMGYASTDTRGEGSGCLMWFDDLIDMRVLPKGGDGRDIFVKMASSELVKATGGPNIRVIVLVVVILMGFLFLGVGITWFWYVRRLRTRDDPMGEGRSLIVPNGQEEDLELPLFSFSVIHDATAGFSPNNKIGQGGFGPVYKGMLEDGKEIAVKRLSTNSSQGVEELKNEVICISNLQHRNLVKLLGCSIQRDENLLIYEYMPNKSLDSFIFDKTKGMLLDWATRFDIIKGIARGLLYLHQDSRLRIIHRDLKASNILLDKDMNPKISDFGIARSFRGNQTEANTERVVGTYGYMSPEYALDGLFSVKSDAFSFGVLVLEIVSGKKNRKFIDPETNNNLIGHAWSLHNEAKSMELMDECLAESCRRPEVERSILVGLLCVQQNAGDRPNMSSVNVMLSGEGALPQPKQPAFFMEKELLVADFSSSTCPEGSVNDITNTEVQAR